VYIVEDVLHAAWYNTVLVGLVFAWFASEDRVRLSTTSLPIRHYDSIESIEHIIHHRLCQLSIAIVLTSVRREDAVELEITFVEAWSDERHGALIPKMVVRADTPSIVGVFNLR